MLIIESTKIDYTGGHIGIRLIIEIAKKKKINWRPYWNYANYRDGQNRINRRPYLNYANYKDGKKRIIWRPYWIYSIHLDYQKEIGFMIIIEMAKIELIGGHIGYMLVIEIAKKN